LKTQPTNRSEVWPRERIISTSLAKRSAGSPATRPTTDDMIGDLIAGGIMLAFGGVMLLTWSFQR